MYCTKCGAQNPDTGKFCEKCGGALQVITPVAAKMDAKKKIWGGIALLYFVLTVLALLSEGQGTLVDIIMVLTGLLSIFIFFAACILFFVKKIKLSLAITVALLSLIPVISMREIVESIDGFVYFLVALFYAALIILIYKLMPKVVNWFKKW